MPELLTRFLLGAIGAILIATLAKRRRSLSRDGALAAVIVGTVVVGAGGWWWGVILVAFFASASALSNVRRDNQAQATIAARGAERDAVQVIANGLVATLIAALGLITGPELSPARFAIFCGAMAAVTADTWATEIGRLSRAAPRLITSGRIVPPGVSGGLTRLGTSGSALGGGLIGALAALGAGAGWAVGEPWPLLIGTTAAGLTGSRIDSLLGATLQAAYRCPDCEQLSERHIHTCGTPTDLVRGHAWITNDVVNVAASLAGALLGGAVWLLTR